jgi:tripartite-type tricarboxylate transporter receptor subunit TctC
VRRIFFAGRLFAIALILASGEPLRAQEWPTRPMTMIVPFAAGGPADTVARILSPGVSELLGQQVIIENVGGSGGMVGSARVAKASPDGYQFVLGNVGTHAANQTFYKSPLLQKPALQRRNGFQPGDPGRADTPRFAGA